MISWTLQDYYTFHPTQASSTYPRSRPDEGKRHATPTGRTAQRRKGAAVSTLCATPHLFSSSVVRNLRAWTAAMRDGSRTRISQPVSQSTFLQPARLAESPHRSHSRSDGHHWPWQARPRSRLVVLSELLWGGSSLPPPPTYSVALHTTAVALALAADVAPKVKCVESASLGSSLGSAGGPKLIFWLEICGHAVRGIHRICRSPPRRWRQNF